MGSSDALSADIVAEYEKNGAVCLRQVLSPSWLEKVEIGIAKNLLNPSQFAEHLRADGEQGSYFNDYFNWQQIPELQDFILHSPVARLVQQLMRASTVTFYHEHVLVKDPGASTETPWHQDQSYYPFNGDQACSVWIPVDKILPKTTLKFVAGSHKLGWFHPRKFATSVNYAHKNEEGVASSCADIVYQNVPSDAEISQMDILEWTLQPGDCIVFHMKALHGAEGNKSSIPRRVLSTRWFGDDVVMAERPWMTSPPITGNLKVGDHPSKDLQLFPLFRY